MRPIGSATAAPEEDTGNRCMSVIPHSSVSHYGVSVTFTIVWSSSKSDTNVTKKLTKTVQFS